MLQTTLNVGEHENATSNRAADLHANGQSATTGKDKVTHLLPYTIAVEKEAEIEDHSKRIERQKKEEHALTPGVQLTNHNKHPCIHKPSIQMSPMDKATQHNRRLADWERKLLIIAGDVESNPGPVQEKEIKKCGTCQKKIKIGVDHLTCNNCGNHSHKQKQCSKTTKHQIDTMDKSQWTCKECKDDQYVHQPQTTNNQPETEPIESSTKQCRECKKYIKRGDNNLECAKCKKNCHKKKECSGVSRDHLKLMDNNRWLCKECKDPVSYTRAEERRKEGAGEKSKCSICKKLIKAADRRMKCSRCKKETHLKESCSGETRKAINDIVMDQWVCPTCTDVEAEREDRRNREENPLEEIEIVSGGTTNKEKMRILQWNADSFAAKKDEFKQVILKNKIDIFLIQESKMNSNDKIPTIPGYTILSKPRKQPRGKESTRGGGLLTGFKNTIPYREIKNYDMRDTDDGITEWQMIEIPLGEKKKLRITNIYIPSERAGDCRGSTQDTVVSTRFWPKERYDLLAGDFNAHSDTWDKAMETDEGRGKIDEKRGKIIDRWTNENDMVPLNTGDGTHINRRTGKESAPDIAIVKNGEEDRYEWKVLKKLGASDHYPIMITRDPEEMNRVNTTTKQRWDMKNANWEDFRNLVEDDLPTNYLKKSTKKLEKILRKTITKAANKHIGRKENKINGKPGYSKKVNEEIEIRNKLKTKVKEMGGRERWRNKCREVKNLIRKEKEESWREFVEGLDTKTNSKQVWKTIRNMDGRAGQRKENEMLVVEGKGYIKDNDKAKQFAKTYKKVSKIPRAARDRIIKRQNRKFLNNEPKDRRKYEEEITWEELLRAIKTAKSDKAPGEDTIPYEFIKELGPKARQFILHLYTEIWGGKPIPQRWRTAVILPLLKDGKDPALPSSYRPISLTDCLGKLLEKVIADRMSSYMEENNLFNESQAGFRKERCTTDQVIKLVQMATDRWQKTDGEVATVVTFFDFERAYDKVWREGLISKMIKLNLPYRFIKYARLFLSARKTMVEINGVRSKEFFLNEGLPQGSAISPLLFLLFINDITDYMPPDAATSLFADDTAASVECGKDREEAERKMQRNIDGIKQWADDWKMKLNGGKTQVMVISSSDKDIKWKPRLYLEGEELVVVKEYKFLGVTIDSGLRFNSHVNKIVTKARNRMKILKCLAGKEWGQNLETQRALYATYIRSALEYAAPSWYPWISKTSRVRLESVQNECLKVMTRMAYDTPSDFLRLEAGVEPLKVRIEKNCKILWERYIRLDDNDPRKKLTCKETKQRLKSRIGWRGKTAPEMDNHLNRNTPKVTITPMMKLKAQVTGVEFKKNKENYTLEELAKETDLKIAEIDADVEMFTDGSTSGNQQNGGAGVFAQDRNGDTLYEGYKAAGTICSSYDGECVAMTMALEWISNQKNPEIHYAIYTDSLSLVSSLKAQDWKDTHEWLRVIKHRLTEMTSKITICWIPSHCNTYGNDKADKLADRGTRCEQKDAPVTLNITKAKTKNTKWNIGHKRAKEMYGERRRPKEIERNWPMDVRRTYSRLRSDHATELKVFRKRIGLDSEDICIHCDMDAVETIEHVLCKCPQLEEKRNREHPGKFNTEMLVTNPEVCRRLLSSRYTKLQEGRRMVEDEGGGSPTDCTGPQA